MEFLEVAGISKEGRDGFVLQETNFVQAKSQVLAVVGETGSGKTTLLKLIGALIQPDTGNIFLEGKRVEGPNEKLIPGHPKIAYLSQHFELRNNYRVEEILSYANRLSEEDANEIYELCRISQFLKRGTDQLSGGEKQRIALARLLVGSPRLLILDEPFSNLDFQLKQLLKTVLKDLGETLQITSIISSHDPLDTLSQADEILVMQSGLIVQKGKPEEVYGHPVNEYAGAIFGRYNLIGPELAAGFPHIFPAQKAGKTLFTRPEHFQITKLGGPTIKGTVKAVYFMGNYYHVEIRVLNQTIVVQSDTGLYNPGELVNIAFRVASHCFI
ncbi:ABC transporter ATP-binding protein [Flavihumibacter profundi]|uniref:ABC transporter ATP-binding protein n=1 Tax=Flavihumibacter profundi TaxID=2716883 RepID=UPI001CC4ED19|nr:ABC transporter ATP-binding protein [Flavihumibacter profundi]MBZ5856783.1 ABC transporter ATP-binding protein [Flavihumibacter profundi]